MTYGLADVVQQRRLIEASEAEDTYKRLSTAKLDAMLALAEAADCRRTRLLDYFGEHSATATGCGNCDNCLEPPTLWDATDAARRLMSCIYRCAQKSHFGFAATHIIDVLRGKKTEKVEKFGHDQVSTFGIGADLSEQDWRVLLRQLVALRYVDVDHEHFNVLRLNQSSRAVLRGERPVALRRHVASQGGKKARKAKGGSPAIQLTPADQPLFERLRAWRGEVAREHGLPAYVVFHDQTLRAIAEARPGSLGELGRISGVGSRKLENYGEALLGLIQQGL